MPLYPGTPVPPHPGYVSGLRYPCLSPGSTNTACGLNTLFLTPILIGAPVVIDRLIISVQTGAAGNARVGLYSINPDGTFTKIAINTADMSTAVAADLAGSFTSNLALSPGWYAGATCLSATTTMRVGTNSNSTIGQIMGSTTDAGATSSGGSFAAGALVALTYGVDDFFPASIAPGSLTRAVGTIAPNVDFRVA